MEIETETSFLAFILTETEILASKDPIYKTSSEDLRKKLRNAEKGFEIFNLRKS